MQNTIYEVTKEKTEIRGYWKDANGKLYKDFIKLYSPVSSLDFETKLSDLFFKGEKAVFVKGLNKSFICYPLVEGKDLILKNSIVYTINKLKPSIIKSVLRQYNGCTVFSKNNQYIIEVWF